jgi:hypothetical protein
MSTDATFGSVRWDERFEVDEEDSSGQATYEAGDHLPFIGVLGATLARVIQDYFAGRVQRDVFVDLRSVRER